MTKSVRCGNVIIGGGAEVSLQSMTNTDTRDAEATLAQIRELAAAGCDIIRLAVPDMEAAEAFGRIRRDSPLPMVADVHFDHRLALKAIDEGADKVRINPGNIGGRDNVRAVVAAAEKAHIPIRVGVNSGSVEKDIIARDGKVTAAGLVESAMRHVKMLEDEDFTDTVISVKASDPVLSFEAYRMLAGQCDYPLHVGVTEAGTPENGKIVSAVGIGALLMEGIGDTIRVSLTGDPLEEVLTGRKILAACGRRTEPIKIVSCPTCGRTRVDLQQIAAEIEKKLMPEGEARKKRGKRPLTVAVMGCEVNGPGEAKEADIGVACGDGCGLIFAGGKSIKKVDEADIIKEIVRMAEKS